MAITLAEAKVGMADKVDQQIVDMFRRSSVLLDRMVFDNCISPGTGGSTLAYGYIQLKTPSTAAVRTINSEYVPGEAKRDKKTTNAIIMGGAFQIDRVLQNTSGAVDELAFQAEQKIKATANYFHNLAINGDEDEGTFDGLKKLLSGTANELTSTVDLTTSEKLDENYNAFLDEMDSFVSALDGTPSMLLMNRSMLIKLRSIARRAGYYERTQDDFGKTVETYAGIPMVDMFRRSSLLLDNMVFDNVISPGTGGSTLTYGYIQLKTPATANIRTINAEYTPGEAKREKKTTGAIIMGGAFQIDRVVQNTAGAADEMAFQAEQKIKATANYFHNLVINGSAGNEEGYVGGTFDGLKKLLTGTQNEITSGVALNTSAELDENYNAFLDEMDSFLSVLDGSATMLLMNREMLVKLRAIARRAGYYQRSQDDFGNFVETYAGIPMVDMGKYFDGEASTDVIPTEEGKTAIYAVCLGLDGFHGISPMGDGVINSYMPDLNAPGAVKTGEVELVAGVALKNTLKAAVLKDIAIGQ